MARILGVLTETQTNERRVTIIPAVVPTLRKAGFEVLVQPGAGATAGFSDREYTEKGANLASSGDEIFSKADVLPVFHVPTREQHHLRASQIVVGLLNPLGDPKGIQQLAQTGATAFALELLPRITRAQSMDVLSSMATISGYRAVLLAAERLDKLFPLLMTAAGTITPANVFVIGAGVAGLQAIATAKRLGAVVLAYDVRPAVKEQVESLGAKFLELQLETAQAEGAGGYAKAMDEEFYRKQREAMTKAVAGSDAVITTAAVPGKPAPKLITEDMVKCMRRGAVIVDLAAETGGNCELTKPGETIDSGGVTIIGPLNLPATAPRDASQMFARNVAAFLQHAFKNGELQLNQDDEILRETLVTHDGQVVHNRIKELLTT